MFSPSGSVYSPNVDSHILVPAPGGKYVLENGSAVNRAYADFYHPQTEGLAPRSVDDYAEELLGLSHSQANWLFASHRSVEELVAGVRFIILNPDATGTDLNANCNL
jgi:hypothetical protein